MYMKQKLIDKQIYSGLGITFLRSSVCLCFMLVPVLDVFNGYFLLSFGSSYGIAVLWKSQFFVFAAIYMFRRHIDNFYFKIVFLPALAMP